MQAKLELSEFAYLLHTLGAEKVVGVNNEQLFPNESTLRDALLQRGFTRLQEHGWFVAEANTINANDRLMLMVAVVANPNHTISVTHYVSTNVRQTLTYYMSQGIIVEQFITPDGDYVLSQLTTIDEVVGRVREVFSPFLAAVPGQKSLIFAAGVFEAALSQAKAGDTSALKQALLVNDILPEALDDVADTIRQLRPVGRIEGAAITGQHLQAWNELAILCAPNDTVWLVRQDNKANTIELVLASDHQFCHMLDLLCTNTMRPVSYEQ